MTLFLKDPQSRVDHAFAWDDYLDGQVVTASTWSVSPSAAAGISVEASAFDLVRTSVTLGGGASGHVYRVTNRVTFSDGQSDERSLVVRVEDR